MCSARLSPFLFLYDFTTENFSRRKKWGAYASSVIYLRILNAGALAFFFLFKKKVKIYWFIVLPCRPTPLVKKKKKDVSIYMDVVFDFYNSMTGIKGTDSGMMCKCCKTFSRYQK